MLNEILSKLLEAKETPLPEVTLPLANPEGLPNEELRLLGKPRHLVVLNLAAAFVWQIVGAWELPILLWVVPQACCKGSGFRLEGFR